MYLFSFLQRNSTSESKLNHRQPIPLASFPTSLLSFFSLTIPTGSSFHNFTTVKSFLNYNLGKGIIYLRPPVTALFPSFNKVLRISSIYFPCKIYGMYTYFIFQP